MQSIRTVLLGLVCSLLIAACGDSVSLGSGEEGEVIATGYFPQFLQKDGKAVHDEFGTEKWFAFGAISGIGDTAANGIARSYSFQDGTYVVTLTVNILDPEDGTGFYAWIERGEDSDRIPVGKLANPEGNARHFLIYETKDDVREHLKVLISAEPFTKTQADSPSSELVAQGTLRPYKR